EATMGIGDRMVTAESKAAFEDIAFHVTRGALTPEEVQTCRDAMDRLFQVSADHPYASGLTACDIPVEQRDAKNPRALWNGFDLPLFDDRFYDLIFHPKIALTMDALRSEEHTSELQSRSDLVCRLLLEKKK